MKTRFIQTLLGACAFFALNILAPQPSRAQPQPKTQQQLSFAVNSNDKGLFVTVRATNVSAAKVLGMISTQTNTEIVVTDDAPIAFLNLTEVSPQNAIVEVAKAAKLFTKLVGKTYVVSQTQEQLEAKQVNKTLELSFRDIPVAELFKILSDQFGISITVDPKVKGNLLVIYLLNETPEHVVEKVADAAGLDLTVTQDGYVVKNHVQTEK